MVIISYNKMPVNNFTGKILDSLAFYFVKNRFFTDIMVQQLFILIN